MDFVKLAKEKEKKIRDFQSRKIFCSPSGQFLNIVPKTIYIPEGRQKIIRGIKAKFRRLFRQSGIKSWRVYMFTFTYEGFSAYQLGDFRQFLNKFLYPLRRMKKQGKISTFYYFWVCELQKRGVPHYHLLVFVPQDSFSWQVLMWKFGRWKKRYGESIFSALSLQRAQSLWRKGWVFASRPVILSSRKSADMAFRYSLKYLEKSFQEKVNPETGEVDETYREYLGKLIWVRKKLGNFRLWGGSRLRRWGKVFLRKTFLEMQRKALQYDFREAVQGLLEMYHIEDSSDLDWIFKISPWLIGYAEKRVGKIVRRFSHFPANYFEKGVDKLLLRTYNIYRRKKQSDIEEIAQILLEGGF